MLSRCIFIASFALLAESLVYDRCDVAHGPATWATLPGSQCGGAQQTPINLCGAVPFPRRDSNSRGGGGQRSYSLTVNGYNNRRGATIQNTGHTLQLSLGGPSSPPTLRIPYLHELVGRSAPNGPSSPVWTFAQLHVHYGRESEVNAGSEHAMEGRRFAAEMHLVHFNPTRGADLSTALASGAKDAVLVVGVFLDIGEYESNLVKLFAAAAPTLQPKGAAVPLPSNIQLADLFNANDQFYSYGGSLTTPGCVEQVTWIVMKTPKTITPESLELLKLAKDESLTEAIALYGNYRPIQPLNGRTVYSSRVVTTTVCQATVNEPCWDCSPSHAVRRGTSKPADLSTIGAASPSPQFPMWIWVVVGTATLGCVAIITAALTYSITTRAHQAEATTQEIEMSHPFHQVEESVLTGLQE